MKKYQNKKLNFELTIPDNWHEISTVFNSFNGILLKSKPKLFGTSLSCCMTIQVYPSTQNEDTFDTETRFFEKEAELYERKFIQTTTIETNGKEHLSAVYLINEVEVGRSPVAIEVISKVRKQCARSVRGSRQYARFLRGMSTIEFLHHFARKNDGVIIKEYIIQLGLRLYDIKCAYAFGSVDEAIRESVEEDRVYNAVARSLSLINSARTKSDNVKKFDFFISYKSQNVQIARKIADQMIADGMRVWFAEYQILLEKREDFLFAIERGLSQSEYGIAITNNNYIQSECCKYELENLLRNCGSKKIIEVMMPKENEPHCVFPELNDSYMIESADINEILAGISKNTDSVFTNIVDTHSVSKQIFEGKCEGVHFELDCSGWKQTSKGSANGNNYGLGAEFQYINNIKIPLFVNIYFGLDPSIESYNRFNVSTHDDRELYNSLIDYAKQHLAKFSANITGVHLLFYKGKSQIALTYKNAGIWMRKCSITLHHPALRFPAEFVFTFGVIGSFKDYCRYVPLMDSFCLSLKMLE